jgi:hypothetical protein
MAGGTEGDEVLLGIVATVVAKLFVVDLQIRHRTARLTSPCIAMQNLLPQILV